LVIDSYNFSAYYRMILFLEMCKTDDKEFWRKCYRRLTYSPLNETVYQKTLVETQTSYVFAKKPKFNRRNVNVENEWNFFGSRKNFNRPD